MVETDTFLFVYGTLLDERNPFGVLLKSTCSFHKKGRFNGKLFDLGEYPGAIYLPNIKQFVYGNIFTMNKPAETLKMLDDYEGFGEVQPQPNEFIRQIIEVEAETKIVNCWVYLYNQPADGHWQITSGDYMEYIGI
jgi:gamma-glutamylcyclotransferase (GGCT)/AIG2-like uncharacterized protein YtfP